MAQNNLSWYQDGEISKMICAIPLKKFSFISCVGSFEITEFI